jgi:hypothetical protein
MCDLRNWERATLLLLLLLLLLTLTLDSREFSDTAHFTASPHS